MSDESVASLIEFLHTFIEALKRHYTGQLLRHDHQHAAPVETAPQEIAAVVLASAMTAQLRVANRRTPER